MYSEKKDNHTHQNHDHCQHHEKSHGMCSCGSSATHSHEADVVAVAHPAGEGGTQLKDGPDPDDPEPSNRDETSDDYCGCDHEHNHNHGHDELGKLNPGGCGDSCACNALNEGPLFDVDDDHDHDHGSGNLRGTVLRLSLSAVALVAALFVGEANTRIAVVCFIASYLVAGYPVIIDAVRNLIKKRPFDETLLMTIATIGAAAIGEWMEAALVMLLFGIGQLLEGLAVAHSKKSIAALLDLKPDSANLLVDGAIKTVSPEEVAVGDLVVVRPFERFPLDGRVTEGIGEIDTSALTGESMPQPIEPGSTVLSGSVNGSSAVTLEVEKRYADSTVLKIIRLTEEAASRKTKSERFITKFARVYTPIVVLLAVLVAVLPPVITGLVTGVFPFSRWIYTALTFLIISCPCALVISVPLTYVAGIGCSSKQGILVKGADSLEGIIQADCAAFDKTGTLTKGIFGVTALLPADGVSKDGLLAAAAHAEHLSTHPIAGAILKKHGAVDAARVTAIEDIPGRGVKAVLDGKTVLSGNERLLRENGVAFDLPEGSFGGESRVFVALDGRYLGCILVGDAMKPDARDTVRALKDAGIHTVMLTGDSDAAAESAATATGVDEYHAALLPKDKLDHVERLKGQYRHVVFLGDGINDAPVITAAGTGISMGGLGSDAAIEASDIVLMTDEPKKLLAAIGIAKRTRKIVVQNVVFSLGVKLVIMALSFFTALPLWLAVVADVGVTLIAVLNALRALQYRENS